MTEVIIHGVFIAEVAKVTYKVEKQTSTLPTLVAKCMRDYQKKKETKEHSIFKIEINRSTR